MSEATQVEADPRIADRLVRCPVEGDMPEQTIEEILDHDNPYLSRIDPEKAENVRATVRESVKNFVELVEIDNLDAERAFGIALGRAAVKDKDGNYVSRPMEERPKPTPETAPSTSESFFKR